MAAGPDRGQNQQVHMWRPRPCSQCAGHRSLLHHALGSGSGSVLSSEHSVAV